MRPGAFLLLSALFYGVGEFSLSRNLELTGKSSSGVTGVWGAGDLNSSPPAFAAGTLPSSWALYFLLHINSSNFPFASVH